MYLDPLEEDLSKQQQHSKTPVAQSNVKKSSASTSSSLAASQAKTLGQIQEAKSHPLSSATTLNAFTTGLTIIKTYFFLKPYL